MLDYDLFKEIESYAHRHAASSKAHYLNRNQGSSKLFINCLRGKIAEYCCYFSMTNAGYILKEPPDLKIYSECNKSYDADLVCIGKGKELYDVPRYVHVKSVSRETYSKIGASFLIEKNDNLCLNPQSNHYFSVMLQHSLTHYTFYKWLDCRYVKYSEPRNSRLTSKYAVYL